MVELNSVKTCSDQGITSPPKFTIARVRIATGYRATVSGSKRAPVDGVARRVAARQRENPTANANTYLTVHNTNI